MKNKEATFLKVKHFVAKNLVEKEERLTLETTLEDLGVDGIDGLGLDVIVLSQTLSLV